MSRATDIVMTFDELAKLPADQVVDCLRVVRARVISIEGKSDAWKVEAMKWFADELNAACLRRDLNDDSTKH